MYHLNMFFFGWKWEELIQNVHQKIWLWIENVCFQQATKFWR
jgi:hypothetical protein